MLTTTSFSAVNISLAPTLGADEVWAAYQAECAKHEQRVQATAAIHDAMLAVFEGMGVKDLPVKGALFALASQVPDVTEEMIKTCCEANPGTFTFLPAHGMRKATVSRVQDKTEPSSTSQADNAEKVDAVVKAITDEPYKGAVHYKSKLGFDKAQWQKAVDLAIKAGAIAKNGERGSTTYFPKAA